MPRQDRQLIFQFLRQDPADLSLVTAGAGIAVTPNAGLATTEAGGTASFSVALEYAPTADVIIALASSNRIQC